MINQDIVLKLYQDFLKDYDIPSHIEIWTTQSKKFRAFWNDKILYGKDPELNDQEIDEIVRILDSHGKGNTKKSFSLANVLIPQGVWRRMFNELKSDKPLSKLITEIFTTPKDRISLINNLYKLNKDRKNSLTGQSGNAINTFLAAYDPFENLSIVSLNDRDKLIRKLSTERIDNLKTIGDKIVTSSKIILNYFKEVGIGVDARTLTSFCYSPSFKHLWKDESTEESTDYEDESVEPDSQKEDTQYLFYMERQLEDFLIENWDKTELGSRLDLIVEKDEIVSQQYITQIGRIDILAKDKVDNRYVIIELKKNQTSDDTIGQLTRYMGWIEEHLSNGSKTKGIIIAGKYDERLYYALKKVPDVEIFIYSVNFQLKKFSK
jgi:hypothetical protein